MEITLSLPEELVAKATNLAARSGKNLEEVLRDTLSLTFSAIDCQPEHSKPWSERTDSEVLQLCDLNLSAREDQQLTELLTKQRERHLTASEHTQLMALMRRHNDALLLKAEALREAVSRGLKPPLKN